MHYEVIVRSGAREDIVAIFRWYEENQPGWGDYFLLCLDASIERLARKPTAHRIIRHEYRRFFVHRFPVGIFYIVQGNTIYIDLVESLVRDPARIKERLRD